MNFTKVTFEDVVVPAAKIDRYRWEYCFSNYLIAPHLFDKDTAKAQDLLTTLTGEVGLGKEGAKLLEGLKDRREVKILRRWWGLQKAPMVAEIVKAELDAGAYKKLCILGTTADCLTELHENLKDRGAMLLFEGTPAVKRARIIKRFQTQDKSQVLILHMPAAVAAIDLTIANEVIVAEADWRADLNPCAIMRCHNANQKKPVRVRFFALEGLDAKIQRALKQSARVTMGEFQKDEIASPFDD